MSTPLRDRMRLHTAGQITWPEPELNMTCAECSHFNTAPFEMLGKGSCRLVAVHQGINGKGFDGATAIACPQISKKA